MYLGYSVTALSCITWSLPYSFIQLTVYSYPASTARYIYAYSMSPLYSPSLTQNRRYDHTLVVFVSPILPCLTYNICGVLAITQFYAHSASPD